MADYIMTIDSDGEDQPQEHIREKDDAKFDSEFVFDVTGDPYVDVIDQQNILHSVAQGGLKPVCIEFFAEDLNAHLPLPGPNFSR
jgi:ATP-dependent RNA helicase DDX27